MYSAGRVIATGTVTRRSTGMQPGSSSSIASGTSPIVGSCASIGGSRPSISASAPMPSSPSQPPTGTTQQAEPPFPWKWRIAKSSR